MGDNMYIEEVLKKINVKCLLKYIEKKYGTDFILKNIEDKRYQELKDIILDRTLEI
jgi:hypothetical protein